MPNIVIGISDETIQTLVNIGEFMGLHVNEEGSPNLTEVLEVVIDHIANSVDAQLEATASGDGSPITLQDALEELMNPNISTVFKVPDTGDVEQKSLTWEQIVALSEYTPSESITEITKEAMTIVFNQLSQDEWSSSHAERLIDETIKLLEKKGETTE